jgi:hypothetical protein
MAFQFEFRKKWYAAAGDILLLFVTGTGYLFFESSEVISMFIYVAFVITFSLITFKKYNDCWRRIAVCVWSFATILLLDGICYMIILLWRFQQSRMNDILADILTIAMLYLIFRIVKQKNPYALYHIHPGYYIAFTVVGVTNAAVLSLQSACLDKTGYVRWTFLVISLGVILQMALVLILAVSRNLWKEKEELNRYYLSIQEEHYHYLESREEETKRFRHDIRNHLFMLEKLLKENQMAEASEYIHSMLDIVDSSHNYVTVGNPIVDAIINLYMSLCRERKIHFEIHGHMPVQCEIPAFDLCTIFSNLIQNAVEATETCREKWIHMQFRYDERNIYVRQANTYTDLHYENGKLISTKGGNHGYGTSNIQKSIEKYGGMIAYEISDEQFVALLEMPQTIRVEM